MGNDTGKGNTIHQGNDAVDILCVGAGRLGCGGAAIVALRI